LEELVKEEEEEEEEDIIFPNPFLTRNHNLEKNAHCYISV
jgi:hypothetical protein